jgi:hypothetical protein
MPSSRLLFSASDNGIMTPSCGRYRQQQDGCCTARFGWKPILRPIDNKLREHAMLPRYTAEKSGLW